jgi:hypothetical protein
MPGSMEEQRPTSMAAAAPSPFLGGGHTSASGSGTGRGAANEDEELAKALALSMEGDDMVDQESSSSSMGDGAVAAPAAAAVAPAPAAAVPAPAPPSATEDYAVNYPMQEPEPAAGESTTRVQVRSYTSMVYVTAMHHTRILTTHHTQHYRSDYLGTRALYADSTSPRRWEC